jgi:hypothetical protein
VLILAWIHVDDLWRIEIAEEVVEGQRQREKTKFWWSGNRDSFVSKSRTMW